MTNILVTGAGGFIGSHLVTYLKNKGYWVRGADLKYPEYSTTVADEFYKTDLRYEYNCNSVVKNIDWVFNLAADMGGIGYITSYHSNIVRNNSLINMNMLEAARKNNIYKFLFSSSACVYPQYLQRSEDVTPLKESDAFPADAEPGYGWEKLFTELACEYYRKDYGLQTRIVRFHNVYGPEGTYDGGKEKAPAAICRKVAKAKFRKNKSIVIWGDGKQTRSFMHVDDCVEGIHRLMLSDYYNPLNLGTDRLISINELTDIICDIAGITLEKEYNYNAPQGVRGRNSDNTLLKEVLDWQPSIPLEKGLIGTYKWIEERVFHDVGFP